MLAIRNFDAIEVHPCCVVGFADGVEIVETCEPEDSHFWSVYGPRAAGRLAPYFLCAGGLKLAHLCVHAHES